MSRLLIVSNRLPVTVTRENERVRVTPSSGGVATGLAAPHASGGGMWIGWPGPTWSITPETRTELDARLRAQRYEPVHLAKRDVEHYYEGFSNGLLWPLFHYRLDQIPLQTDDWESYLRVNEQFADHIARLYAPGDRVWVHDYQLLLVPQLLRERVPGARIGFFLHIPFPASAVLRALPRREELLRGMLGADLIGFHTPSYVRHFAAALLRILGIETRVDRIELADRDVRVRSFPMGVDAVEIARTSDLPSVRARVSQVRGFDGCRILLGIDRLDYTKGIPRRLFAYEELLRDRPELHGKVRLLQIAVPSRGSVRAYREYRQQIDALVGRINGAYATATWTPLRYVHRAQAHDEVIALYRAADVMLVTPIRDGMNLVAKEFIAARTDEDGVLVLSEFAGAAAELDGAIEVNPYDVQASARAYGRALDLSREERRARMQRLRARVITADVNRWSREFLAQLEDCTRTKRLERTVSREEREGVLRRIEHAQALVLLLDYDGTLVPFAPTPDEAAPDVELYVLLDRLHHRPHTHLHIVSGRSRADLERWFGALAIGLHAEHGLWSRLAGERVWRRTLAGDLPDAAAIGAVLDDWAARTPGSFVERKSAGLAWHWRRADPERGRRQESELRLHLAELLSNVAVEVVVGDRVVEVRPQGVHKGRVVALATAASAPDALVFAVGDDRTDDDLFAVLGPEHVSMRVGPRPGSATLRVPSWREAREVLGELAPRVHAPR